MIKDHMLFVEKYRPEKISDCILPDSLKSTFQEFVNQQKIPNLLISGSAGVGKTTVAKALCKEVGCDYIVINGSDENGIDVLRGKIKNYASSVSLSGGRKVIIIDEADYLNANSLQPALRNAIEEFSINCSFIFTCNYKNRIIEPLHSRCSVIDVKITKEDKQKLMAQFFKRVCWILEQENVEFNKEVVAQVIAKYYPDNRRVLNELQRYSMSGKIDVGLLSQVSDINIIPLVKGLKEKSFSEVRKWLVDNLDNDSHTIYRKIYDNMYEILKPNSIPQLVLLIGKYQYQTAFVVDHEINLMAFFTECMVELEYN
jgi:DNA polymerase III delta prime subunit